MKCKLLFLILVTVFTLLSGKISRISLNEISTNHSNIAYIIFDHFYPVSKLNCMLTCLKTDVCHTILYFRDRCVLRSKEITQEYSSLKNLPQTFGVKQFSSENPLLACFVNGNEQNNCDLKNKYDPCQFINKIDANLKEIVTKLNESLTKLNESVTNLNGSLTKLNESVTNLNESVTNLNGSVTNLNGSLTKLNGSVTNLNGSLTKLNESVTNLNESVTNLNGSVTNLNGSVKNLNKNVTKINGTESNSSDVETFCMGSIVYPPNMASHVSCRNKYISNDYSKLFFPGNETPRKTFDENIEYCSTINMKPLVSLNILCSYDKSFPEAKLFWTGLRLRSKKGITDFEAAILESDEQVFGPNEILLFDLKREKLFESEGPEHFDVGYRCIYIKPSRDTRELRLANCSGTPVRTVYTICEAKEMEHIC